MSEFLFRCLPFYLCKLIDSTNSGKNVDDSKKLNFEKRVNYSVGWVFFLRNLNSQLEDASPSLKLLMKFEELRFNIEKNVEVLETVEWKISKIWIRIKIEKNSNYSDYEKGRFTAW